ncbi:MAG: hypothetical protein AABZ67_02080 [Pseudomonadota bacterium]
MKISAHLEKAEAFERSLAKLNPIEDTELFVVFLMRACTNRLNAALHALDFTTEAPAGNGRIGDLNHTYKPKLDTAPPEELRPVFERLGYIEELRADFVRGPRLLTEVEVAECRAAHADITTRTGRIFERIGRMA